MAKSSISASPAAMYEAKKPVMTDLAGQTLLCLRTLAEENPASLDTYIKLGGYSARCV